MSGKSIIDMMEQAFSLEKNGDYRTAASLYISVLAKDKRHRGALVGLGSIYTRMNKLNEALKCYLKALSLSADYMTLFTIGSLYYRLGQYKKAVISLEKSRSLNPEFYLSPLVMGLSFSKLEDRKAAEKNFIEVLRINPDQKIASTALTLLYYNENRYEEAIAIIDRFAGSDTDNLALREIKSEILYRTGRFDESAEEIKSLKRVSDKYTFYDQFISSIPVESFTDKYGTLQDKISILTEKTEGDSHGLLSLSLCYLFKGETDKAIDYLFQAKKMMER